MSVVVCTYNGSRTLRECLSKVKQLDYPDFETLVADGRFERLAEQLYGPMARWIGHYTGGGRAGGTVEFTVTGELDAGGEVAEPVTVTIHECAPPHRLVVDIPEHARDDARSWWIAVDIAPDGDGAAVTFTQRPVDGVAAADITAGWSWYLDRLGAVLHDTPPPAWSAYAP